MASDVIESTRVFVSNLPRNLSSEQLASHFAKSYSITDAHVLPDRRIGFVGFHDPTTAQNAASHFNRSYIRLSKISVDLARPVQVKNNGSGSGVPTSQRALQRKAGNTELEGHQLTVSEPANLESNKRKRDIRDDGETLRKEQHSHQPQLIVPGSTNEMNNGHRQDQDGGAPLGSDVSKNNGVQQEYQEPASDNDWLRGKTNRVLDLVDPDTAEPDSQDEQHPVIEDATDTQPLYKDNDTHIADDNPRTKISNGRLFIRNLAFDVTESDLETRFSEFGKIQEVHLVMDHRKVVSKGTAYIQFSSSDEAEHAQNIMDGTAFYGRLVHVLPASDKRDNGLTEYDISKMPLKKQKAIRRKIAAGSATFSWNSLYMNPDAVITSIADRLGVAKSEILDPTSANAAVKQAHAETQIIAETKEYLQSQGVQIIALKNKTRDQRSILLKNFPFGTSETELRDLLEPHGQLTRFILPPAGTMAIAQYVESFSASQALKALAYKNLRGSVLYLEKAPAGLLSDNAQQLDANDKGSSDSIIQPQNDDAQPSSGSSTTVFIRNLSFDTTTSRLREVFGQLSGFLSARVKTRIDAKRPGEILSMGFGFVEFRSIIEANSAIAAMNGFRLDGHDLIVKLSTKSSDVAEEQRNTDNARKSNSANTKIIIKNLPFQASKKDVRSLFAPYGQLKNVRVPKKFDNTSRGFAFAEFVTAKEAANAMDALSSTHLLGRRLVLDFVEEEITDAEEQIKMIEKKIEQQSNRVNLNKLMGNGRRKFNVGAAEEDNIT